MQMLFQMEDGESQMCREGCDTTTIPAHQSVGTSITPSLFILSSSVRTLLISGTVTRLGTDIAYGLESGLSFISYSPSSFPLKSIEELWEHLNWTRIVVKYGPNSHCKS